MRVNIAIRFTNFIFQRILGLNSHVNWSVNFRSRVTNPENIRIGKNVWVSFATNGGCYIQGKNGIEIGDDTIFASNVAIVSANHDFKEYDKHIPGPPIKIGKHCWIGVNSTVLPGVTLGDNVIVGAGSVVTKSFPSNVIIAGNPARVIREL